MSEFHIGNISGSGNSVGNHNTITNRILLNGGSGDKTVTLEKIYRDSYNGEIEKYANEEKEIFTKSKDKKYAADYSLSRVGIIYLFRTTSKLDRLIKEIYDHLDKLGSTVSEIINKLSQAIQEYKKEKEIFQKGHKKEVKVNSQKILGFIPYSVDSFDLSFDSSKDPYLIGSSFEECITEIEIATQLGQLNALFDFFESLRLKNEQYSENAIDEKLSQDQIERLKFALHSNDLETFFKIIQAIFASFPYSMKVTEGYFHSYVHFLLTLLNFQITSELETNIGRIDSVIETDGYVYIFEFKSADSSIAINQILSKKYYQKYQTNSKIIVIVGIAFDASERNITDWNIQTL